MKISQREARRLRKRVQELESMFLHQLERFRSEWPSFTAIGTLSIPEATMASIRTARILKHAVVIVPRDNNVIALFASELPRI